VIQNYDCPSCGATLSFESSIAISAVCPFCRSLVIRRDLKVETLGTLAQLPADLSPLQIGTTGEFQGVGFRLAGRLRWHWDGGSWTEWFADCGTGGHVWIAETQGFYTFSREVEQAGLPALDSVQAGSQAKIGETEWTVVDLKTAVCVGGEGELPEIIAQGKARQSVDLQGPHGEFATLEAGAEDTEYFEGRYAGFGEMNFGNLRAVPGWTPGADGQRIEGQSTSFSCPNCAAPVNVRVAGLTMSAVCGSCGTIIDTSDERRQILERVDEKLRGIMPTIPIGKRGTFQGTEYEVIGHVRRRDEYAEWSEYLLFNPWRGFDWLVTYNGHWSFVQRLLETPRPTDTSPHGFRLYANYQAKVVSVLGEFYWQTSTSEVTDVQDFINPPYVLSREAYAGLGEITWSKGKYVEGKEVGDAFGAEAVEAPTGLTLNQPNPFQERWETIRRPMFIALLLLCGLQMYACTAGTSRKVNEGQYVFRRADAAKVMTSEPFTLTGGGMVTVEGQAQVANSWIELDFGLLNEATNERFEKDLEIEYYFGTDSDGSWSEGSQSGSATVSGIPPGKYRLIIEPEADPKITEMPFTMRVRHGGVFWSNFWLMLCLLLAYPIYLFFRASSFERRRWSESDLAPIASSSDDE
jgi:predicted RNA-binding Zn-ribbon protein involved in translation (DUF1610 family)